MIARSLRSFVIAALLAAGVGPTQRLHAQPDTALVYLNPDWSPDGTRIAFESGPDGRLSIFTVGIDGDHLTRLTDDTYNDEGPVWSPDGDRIAFYSNRHAERGSRPVSLQVYVMNADGSDQRRLTDESSALDYSVTWSPDGTRLAFQSRPEIDPGVLSLYVIGLDGTGRTRVTDGRFDDRSPAWSPDGSSILFMRSPPLYAFFRNQTREERLAARASAELALLSLADGSVRQVTDDTVRELDPSWSRAGDTVYYLRGDGPDRAFVRQRQGGAPEVLVEDGRSVSHAQVARTRVSPDGRTLAYARSGRRLRHLPVRPGDAAGTPAGWRPMTRALLMPRLHEDVVDVDGSNLTGLTDNDRTDTSVSFSPDGRSITYVSAMPRGGGNADFDVYTVDIETAESRLLYGLEGRSEQWPLMMRDGRLSVSVTTAPGVIDLIAVDLESGALQTLIGGRGRNGWGSFSRDGRTLVYASNRLRRGWTFDLFVANADGSNDRHLDLWPRSACAISASLGRADRSQGSRNRTLPGRAQPARDRGAVQVGA